MKFTGRNVTISASAKVAPNASIGDGTIIYDNVVIGENVVIANDCVIGEPGGDYYANADYENPQTFIGEGSLIRSHSIIYAGVKVGSGFSCGHRVTIRAGAVIGENCRIGTLSDLQGNLNLGDHVWLHSNVHIGQGSHIDSFVFIYPYVVLTNDPLPPSNDLVGCKIRQFAQIGTGAVLMPGVELGRHCLVGGSAVVTRNVAEYSCVVGNPAKHVKDVRDMKLDNGNPAYPWPYRFDRGMPWEGVGFDAWKESQS